MTIEAMRSVLIERYSAVIHGKLVSDMTDSQVVAIYRSLVDRKDSGLVKILTPKKKRLHEPVKYEQMRMEGV